MKKAALVAAALVFGVLASTTVMAENTKVDKLTVQFVPSREPDEIITATEPLEGMLQAELSELTRGQVQAEVIEFEPETIMPMNSF